MLNKKDVEMLERLVDRSSVYDVLDALSDVLSAKAQHIEENWQDHSLGAAWQRASGQVIRCASTLSNRPGIGRR